MSAMNFPKMFYSYAEGWRDLVEVHPSVMKMLALYVVPMSLIPPAMFAYAMIVTPGAIFPTVTPAFSAAEALGVAGAFFVAEVLMVALMASIIQQMGDVVDTAPAYEDAFILAAVAPTPLWLAPLALFIPSLAVNLAVLALAWVASAALIFHGVYPLFKLETRSKARVMGVFVLTAGVIAWAALIVVLSLVMSIIVGFR